MVRRVLVACIAFSAQLALVCAVGYAPPMGVFQEDDFGLPDPEPLEMRHLDEARMLGDTTTSFTTISPAPTTEAPGSSTSSKTTIDYPAPDSTTSFEKLIISTCEGNCNLHLRYYDEESPCSCTIDCRRTSAYGGCCDYAQVCVANSTTPVQTTTTQTLPPTSPQTTDETSTESPCLFSTCLVGGYSCDQLTNTYSCSKLENDFGCNCDGCTCNEPPTTAGPTSPPTSTAGNTTSHVTTTPKKTTSHDTTSEAVVTTVTTTTTTTRPICPATCYDKTCDDWVPFGDFKTNTRCTFLEKEHDCDCYGCNCNDAFWSTTEDTLGGNNDTTTAGQTDPPAESTTAPPDDKNYGVDTSVVGGGYANSALEDYSVVSGGRGNVAAQEYSVAAGGTRNSLRSNYAACGGGYKNTAQGRFVSIPGGRKNDAAGRHSVILGSAGLTQSTNKDHVMLMNFRSSSGAPVVAEVETPNTVSLQANEIYFNDVDLLALVATSRRLSEGRNEVDAALERIEGLKTTLSSRLEKLRALSA